ncbi:DUF5688 family protein [Ruminococcus sp. RTP21484sp1]|uniref:DUF5688 family protein n=1 Tax=Ruminococcus sp. RTP21484sp1 TaxID=3151395 RepID=UPI003219F3D2
MKKEDIERIIKEIQKRMPACEVKAETINKIGGTREAISCKFPSENYAVILYPDDYQRLLDSGESMQDIGRYLSSQIEQRMTALPATPTTADDFKKGLYIQVINADINRELLESLPHDSWEDMAAVVRYQIPDGENEISFLVTKNNMQQYQMSQGEVMEAAYKNTAAQEFCLHKPEDIMREIMQEQNIPEEAIDLYLSDTDSHLYVLTNKEQINGANALVCPEVLQNIYKEFGEPYYVLPSSTHELILAKDSSGLTQDELRQMVQQVNVSSVTPDVLLSYNLFHYDGRKLSAVQEKEQVLEAARQHKLIH